MLFPNVLVMLSASPRMSGFIYQVSVYISLCAGIYSGCKFSVALYNGGEWYLVEILKMNSKI